MIETGTERYGIDADVYRYDFGAFGSYIYT